MLDHFLRRHVSPIDRRVTIVGHNGLIAVSQRATDRSVYTEIRRLYGEAECESSLFMSEMDPPTIAWLLAGDPAIRWQVLRDLTNAPDADWRAERQKVETEGWGAKLLVLEDADGQWAGGAFFPAGFTEAEQHDHGQPWTATAWALTQLREFGLDPASPSARRMVEQVGLNSHWEEGGQPFWQGEVEECINGRTVAAGAYFGVDVSAIVERLVGQRLQDGGWNCERANGSCRSSFASTINVLEGLLEFERATGGTSASQEARRTGEEYLLARRLFRRLSTGEPADELFVRFVHPDRWRYDVLRSLDYFRAASLFGDGRADPRLEEAIDILHSRRREDGTWLLDWKQRGREWFEIDEGIGQPSRWVTLRARRILSWWDKRPGDGTCYS